jgi:hypothetical protein
LAKAAKNESISKAVDGDDQYEEVVKEVYKKAGMRERTGT